MMPEKLDSYDFSRYPFSEWFDGRIYRLKTGEDFTVKPATMASYLRAEAKKRRISLEVKIEQSGDVVIRSGQLARPASIA
jgi:hypothetical protein